MKGLFLAVILILFYISCRQTFAVSNGLIRRYPPKLFVDSTRLDSVAYISLKKFLSSKSSKIISDTIFIRYTFNGDDCWGSWNNVVDSGVSKIIDMNTKYRDSLLSLRPNISLFEFREPAQNVNKWILLNPQIIIDSTNWLYYNIIKSKSSCGTSVAVFPDRTILRFLTDPHYELVYAKKQDWEKYFKAAAQNKNGY